ncbi:MAG: YlxR family protein [Erysipelotrichales bacterium]|nr:YlxR family protein [Erysipelotrichales bacterium]
MKVKKIPLRTCVVNKTQHPKKELIRIVATKENIVSVDLTGKSNGRGAYLLLTKAVIEKAKKSKALDRKLEVAIPDNIYEELLELIAKDE